MTRGVLVVLMGAALASGCGARADAGPLSGDYCSLLEAAKCATISFPEKRGAGTVGTMQLEGQRYELRWMDTENGHRKFIGNLPGGYVAFDMAAVDGRSVVVKRRGRPDETYAIK